MTRIKNRIFYIWIILLVGVMGVQSQAVNLSAVVTVLASDTYLQRAGTTQPLLLVEGAVAPLGAGDTIITGENGRAFIGFPYTNILYLLPQSRYELTLFTGDEDHISLEGTLEGVAIQQMTDDVPESYQLNTQEFSIVQPSSLFEVWAVPEQLNTVISAEGSVLVQTRQQDEPLEIWEGSGWHVGYPLAPIELSPPYHAPQVLAESIACTGIVNTRGSNGLRLRRGAALDYNVVNTLVDGQAVYIVGMTENSLWYRIPSQSAFGWIYSTLIETECEDLPVFPNLYGEWTEHIRQVTEPELPFLEPFYGKFITNPTFYR